MHRSVGILSEKLCSCWWHVACCFRKQWRRMQIENQVTGTVFDEEGLPMIGATIREATTQVGTLTDLNGWYEIQVPANGVLEVSFIGYERKESM